MSCSSVKCTACVGREAVVSPRSDRHHEIPPINNEMRHNTSRHHTPTRQTLQIGPCLAADTTYFSCRKKAARIRKSTKIKTMALTLATLSVIFLCHYTTASSISPIILHRKIYNHLAQPNNNKQRKNNTGFYYGIRDDHISCASSTQSCSLPLKLSWKPALDDLTSTLQSLPYRITLLARERVEWMQHRNNNRVIGQNSCVTGSGNSCELGTAQSPCQPQQISQEENQPKDLFQKTFLQNSLRNLSQSLQSIISQQQWNLGLCSIADTFVNNNSEKEDILGKAMSLLGGGGTVSHQDNAITSISATTKARRKKKQKKRQNNTGFYYGIREDVFIPDDEGTSEGEQSKGGQKLNKPQKDKLKMKPQEEQRNKNQKDKRLSPPKMNGMMKKKMAGGGVSPEMSNILGETMLELREMREEIISLREEFRAMKALESKLRESERGEKEVDDGITEEKLSEETAPESLEKEIRSRKRDFDRISKEVEKWAVNILFEEERAGNGWKEISCNNLMKKKFNKDGRTQVYLKWMADTRDEQDRESGIADKNNLDYPCIKCFSTIDAPMETVCSFLSNEETISEYNDLCLDYNDVEEITPHSKITWTKMPKILFVKPRDFVTFCSHRWWRDGTQVIVNQACEHEDRPGIMEEGQGDATRGFALRGANFISRDPNDPNKTRITILAHANPGGGLPQWAMNTAVNGVVQIEPFKLFHKINVGACNYQEQATISSQTAHVGSLPGRSAKPAGIAQLGYTCFWPNGGGLKETNPFKTHPNPTGGYDDEEDYDS